MAGLIKTVLCLHHKTIPPSLHFERPNPKIDFANSPFYVNTRAAAWEGPTGMPRRAGVSSLGIGGTNAHVILEEAPERRAVRPGAAVAAPGALGEDADGAGDPDASTSPRTSASTRSSRSRTSPARSRPGASASTTAASWSAAIARGRGGGARAETIRSG